MGIGIGSRISSSSCEGYVPSQGNPNPKNYKVLKVTEIGNFIVMKINYPDARNYEGNKILIFKNAKLVDLINARSIDPHFSNIDKLTPYARFRPDDDGWKMAVHFCRNQPYTGNEFR